jgi:di/tricarboxylate transporter
VVAASRTAVPPRPERAPAALVVFGAVVVAALSGALPIAETVMAGAATMVLTGCVSMEEAYRSVEWHVIVLVAGLLPLGYAMIDTGLAERVAGVFTGLAGDGDHLVVVAATFAVTTAVTQIIGGQVSAVLVGPLALEVAAAAGMSPHAMAVTVAIGASTAFLTPTAHPVNAMMMGTAGYRSKDFVLVGLGLTVVTLAALLVGMWVYWGVR